MAPLAIWALVDSPVIQGSSCKTLSAKSNTTIFVLTAGWFASLIRDQGRA